MLQDTRLALASLCIYRPVLDDPVMKSFTEMLDTFNAYDKSNLTMINCFHEFLFTLASSGHTFKNHLLYLIAHDSNPFSREAELSEFAYLNPGLVAAAKNDLAIMQKIYHFDWDKVFNKLSVSAQNTFVERDKESLSGTELEPLGQILDKAQDWTQEIDKLADHYRTKGCGPISRFRALRWDEKQNQLLGIEAPDPFLMEELVGYHSQKEQLCRNTEQFLQGNPANNILLYGSRGTGKSTMVKALLNKYYDDGLRMVEVACEDLGSLPEIITILRPHSLKFIIFIDDLSFEENETKYKGLKAIMEGSLESRPANVLLYATSNRRHLVREYHSDRDGIDDEIHTNDTMQEKLSLADRFGLTITFPSPSQQIYLEIVENIAGQRQLDIDPELLRRLALQWERAHHGPSGRTARQFVDSLGYLAAGL